MQTYREKVEWLLKYCAEYDGHEFMYDEHISEIDRFDIRMEIENKIQAYMEEKCIIILTGDAGDGKSRIINNIRRYYAGEQEWKYINDFSELNGKERKDVLDSLVDILNGDTEKKIFIAANSGIFMSEVIEYQQGLLERLKGSAGCVVIDFSKRNLAEDEKEFGEIVRCFLKSGDCEECKNCVIKKCPFIHNLQELTREDEAGRQRLHQLRNVYYALFLKGIHISFRDLLSSLAYAVTAGRTCRGVCEENRGGNSNPESLYYYNNLFCYEKGGSRLLKEMKKTDPGSRNHRVDRRLYLENILPSLEREEKREAFKRLIRQKYFENPEELLEPGKTKVALLNVEYLEEYWRIIDKLKRDGILDAEDEEQEVLWKFELGINRIFNAERSDAQLVLFDAPLIIDPRVRIEHEAGDEMALCFCTQQYYDNKAEEAIFDSVSTFLCASVSLIEEHERWEKLVVDYELFRQIMMAAERRYDAGVLNKAEDMRIKNFIAKIFQNVTTNEKIKVTWLGDSKVKYESFELYPVHQLGVRNRKSKVPGTKTYRIGKG